MRKAHQYRKRPVVIEAILFDGDNYDLVAEFCSPDDVKIGNGFTLAIPTLEGDMTASKGDYIIRGVKGELYPCKPDIFELTYEPVKPEPWIE